MCVAREEMFGQASRRAGGQGILRPSSIVSHVKKMAEAISRREAGNQPSRLNLINLDDNYTYVEHTDSRSSIPKKNEGGYDGAKTYRCREDHGDCRHALSIA